METDSSDDAATSVSRHRVSELYEENCKLNQLVTQCQQKAHLHGIEVSLLGLGSLARFVPSPFNAILFLSFVQFKQLEDKIVLLENEIKELNNKNDETEYELEKTRDKAFRLDRQLADTMIKLNNLQKAAANMGTAANNNNHNSAAGNNSHADQNGHGSCKGSNSDSRQVVNLTDKQVSRMEQVSDHSVVVLYMSITTVTGNL